ncbi:hypothetical protein CC79DRAFT_1335307 [Sarocladium strictum]
MSTDLDSRQDPEQGLQEEKPNSPSSMHKDLEPTTPHIERPSHDPDSNSGQPAQASRRNSVSTIRPGPEESPNHLVQDLSRWQAQCRPFLLETIQRHTEQNVKAMTLDKSILRRYLREQLEQHNRHDDEHLTTLNLFQPAAVEDQVMADRASTRLSSSSDSSVNSMSSQMSDSFLNDVQQSAALLKLSLNSISKYSVRSTLRKMISHFAKGSIVEGHLVDAVNAVRCRLSDFEPQMSSIGFSDVGLELNRYDEVFKDDILRFLTLERKYSKDELRRRLDQTGEWKPWKDHSRPKTWKPRDEYTFLTQRVRELGTGVGDTLQSAIQTRDGFISEATNEMNSIVLDFARDTGFKVQENWEGNMLVERIFKQEHFLLSQDVTVGGT